VLVEMLEVGTGMRSRHPKHTRYSTLIPFCPKGGFVGSRDSCNYPEAATPTPTRLKSLLSSSISLPLFLFLKIHLLCHDVEGILGMQMMMTLATNAAEARHSAGF